MKKLLSFLMVLSMLLSFSACGSRKTDAQKMGLRCFEENPEFPRPEYFLSGVTFHSMEDTEKAYLYVFDLPDDPDEANQVYHHYQYTLLEDLGMESVDDGEGYASFYKDGKRLGRMRAGGSWGDSVYLVLAIDKQ